ncbi:hypothetical protein IAQ61_008275 [Plenodomus lingam]|uniref:uncharacterized protein n=1 Tax=Leptosphaeria maculans TaxID=5022 RepID=UPI00331B5B85|nr:hypothetical protein IAQ61_008275 [Plenodomus lingam]
MASCAVLLFNITHQVVLQFLLNQGCGKPDNVNCTFQSLDLRRISFIEDLVIFGGHFLVKLTFLLFYMRLTSEQIFRILTNTGFVLNSAIILFNILLTVLQCTPFEKILHPTLPPEVKCINARTVTFTPPVLNIAMDLYILCIPIPIVWNLQMAVRRKATILFVLGFGLVSVTVAVLRLPLLLSLTSMKTDTSTDIARVIIVASFEVQCAIVAVNLPSLTSMWTAVREKQRSPQGKEPWVLPSYQPGPSKRKAKGKISMDSIIGLELGLIIRQSQEHLV